MWGWIAIGLGSFLGLSALVGFALARVLGAISHRVVEMYETEGWVSEPLTRAVKDVAEQQPDEVEAKSQRVTRLG